MILLASQPLTASAQGPAEEAAGGISQPSPPANETGETTDRPAPPPATDLAVMGSGLPVSGFDIVWNIGIFILVLALLYLVLKALGRVSRLKGAKNGRSGFVLRGVQALDSRKYLAAVEIDGRMIVVGVSADRITPVAHWLLDLDENAGLDISSDASQGSLDLHLPEDNLPSFDLGLDELKSLSARPRPSARSGPGGTKK